MDKTKRGGDVDRGGQLDKTEIFKRVKQYFSATTVETKKLVDLMTRCLCILLEGQELTDTEATDLFFHITRLFRYKDKDVTLRRLIYIGIKLLSQQAENVYVVTSSLTTDVSSTKDNPAIRASALRALCQMSDVTTNFAPIEQYLKLSLVDKHPIVVSAALTSLIRIAQFSSEMVRKFNKEIQKALNSDSYMVQYHALSLNYISCQDDRLETSKLLNHCINRGLTSPLAICLLLRLLRDQQQITIDETKKYTSYILDCLNHSSRMVEYEACLAAVKFKAPLVISRMRKHLTSSEPILRFASVRLLNELAATSSTDVRFWSVHRIGTLCKLHLLNKRYKPGDDIIGILDFTNSTVACAKYYCILQCEEIQMFELKQEFSLAFEQNDFAITIPPIGIQGSVLHCVLSFLFYIADKKYPKTLFEDRAGTIELGPSELETKLFSCDFPLAIYT